MARRSIVIVVALLVSLISSACSGQPAPNIQAIETQTAAKIFATQTASVPNRTDLLGLADTTAPTCTYGIHFFKPGVPVANIRSGPGRQYQVIGTVKQGDLLEVFGQNADGSWMEVAYTAFDNGWVLKSLGSVSFNYDDGRLLCKDAEVIPITSTAINTESNQTTIEKTACPDGCTTPPSGCVIKGNIKYQGTDKIYHLPGCEDYEKTVISSDYGERWFCTEAEAVANGWRKAYNCP